VFPFSIYFIFCAQISFGKQTPAQSLSFGENKNNKNFVKALEMAARGERDEISN